MLASVRALGYVPGAIARVLAARRTGLLSLYFPVFDAVEDADGDPTVTATDALTVEAADGRSATVSKRGGFRHPD